MPRPSFPKSIRVAWLLHWSACGVMVATAGTAHAEARFNRDVRPILAENCLSCHGPDARQRKGKLRLDLREEAMKPAKSGAVAIKPGQPEGSELLARIRSDDPDEVMPPPNSRKHLTAAQKATLEQWIAEGAKYEPHWAFTPIERLPVPLVKDNTWPRNEIDAFILAKLEQEGLSPAPPAAPETLLRRVSLIFGVISSSELSRARALAESMPPSIPPSTS